MTRPTWRLCGLFAVAGVLAIAVVAARTQPAASLLATDVDARQADNPRPIRLMRPATAPLSAMAELGRLLFFDAGLSSSGRLSCASCHSPQHAYAAPDNQPAMRGGPQLSRQGVRAVPSLMYLERQPAFSIGPDDAEKENVNVADLIALSRQSVRAEKTAAQPGQSAANLVPQGGLFWDGRADTLQHQALSPLLDPREMDGGSIETIAGKLRQAPYAERLTQLFGAAVFNSPRFAVTEALFAVGRYQIEDQSFHPYTSKFDYWLEGRARLTAQEARGYALFTDPAKANCAGCHLDQASGDGLPPLFTDHQFEALGAPRNNTFTVNDDADYFDLGICGPYRSDLARETQYCGMFATPTLRNVATRRVFFHNGVFRTLRQVMDFYDFRDIDPAKIYPRQADGAVRRFDDLPPRYVANVDVTDAPFNRKPGDTPAMTADEEEDIIAFLNTLTDGYRPQP